MALIVRVVPKTATPKAKAKDLQAKSTLGGSSAPTAAKNQTKPAGSGVAAVRQLRTTDSMANKRPFENQSAQNQQTQGSMDTRPAEPEPCPICLDCLGGQQLGVCVGADGHRSCSHYFHLACLRRVEGACCPTCRVRFFKRAPLPSIHDDAASWCSLVSLSGRDALSRREASAALSATLLLPPDAVDALVESSWPAWSQGGELLSAGSLHHVAAAIAEQLPGTKSTCSSASSSPKKVTASGLEEQEHLSGPAEVNKRAEEDSGHLGHGGHGRSGTVCKCGQVHVRRGDRVRRGPGSGESEGNGEVAAGQLGTIVRVAGGQESVTVRWDRSPDEKLHSYIWPDPDGHVLAPASYREVDEDVCTVQKQTGLSSAAAEELLRRVGFKAPEDASAKVNAAEASEICEEKLRKPLQLFHRVRILPDSVLLQQWFDSTPPCKCKRSGCSGGVKWTSRADKHVGREAVLLQIDASDDTVLVQTCGPCECEIWYPRLAVAPAYDPDLADALLFKLKDLVECKTNAGWERGVVDQVLWTGGHRLARHPYQVTLASGTTVTVPSFELIRGLA